MCHPLLYLTWQVQVFVTDDEEIRIFSDVDEQVHNIYAGQKRFNDPEVYRAGWYHELAHAAHAELLDPLFSSPYLSAIHEEEDQLFKDEFLMFQDCWQLVDIWIDDMLQQIDPSLKQEDLQLFINSIESILLAKDYVVSILLKLQQSRK
jgi:hypothetical protein